MSSRYFGLVLCIAVLSVQGAAFSEVPVAPGVPQPEPEPQPMPTPKPQPIREPFPGESDAEKIQRLMQENRALKSKNSELEGANYDLKQQIADLQQIISEQIKVILQLLDQIKQTVFVYTSPGTNTWVTFVLS